MELLKMMVQDMNCYKFIELLNRAKHYTFITINMTDRSSLKGEYSSLWKENTQYHNIVKPCSVTFFLFHCYYIYAL